MLTQNVGIDKKVTTYVARHSFCQILRTSGATTEFIQDTVGRGCKKTTEDYLGSFEDDMKIDLVSNLTAFKKKN